MIWAMIAVSCAFATAFLGFGGICLGAFGALLSTHAFVVTALAMVAAFVLILVAVGLFIFGVPAWLTPRWYRHRSGA
ncbi:hypothetical protein [Curtobacterium sp. ME26]|uniref:hypothetical protein n=1 Tax=Curtobacterium sp. ME26 TaxID=2744254 RepID=UPI0015F48B11|nr:hypothetical protein [Curtobacterium sp. ME26]